MERLPVIKSTSIPTVNNPLEQFLAGQLSERTKLAYYADLCHFFGSADIDLDAIRAITFQDVIAFRNQLAQQEYKRTTINRKLSSLKAFFKMMVASGIIDKNPADSSLVRGYKVDDLLTGKAIASSALKKILQAIAAEENDLIQARDQAIFYLLTFGGLRRSEVANVSWEDIRQEGAFFILTLPDTKSGVLQDIKLQPEVVHFLAIYRDALERHRYPAAGKAFISLSRNSSHGKPLTDQSINLMVKKYALKAGVPQNITAHMFRHTCCTLAIEGGAKPQQVQAHLRHKDLKTTMRYYENREKLVDNASDYIHMG